MEAETTQFCRCCGSQTSCKGLVTKYILDEKEEIYLEMLKKCFSIDLILDNSNNNGICEECIKQLRDALDFRKKVEVTEEEYRKKIFYVAIDESNVNIKLENSDYENMETDVLAQDDASNCSNVTDYKVPVPPSSLVTTKKIKLKKQVTKKATKKKLEDRKKIKTESSDTETKKEKISRKKKALKKTGSKFTATPDRCEHRINLTNILQHSNASPFRDKTARGFSCLYCSKLYLKIKDLREHTANKEEKYKINKINDYKLNNHPIKIDITDLKCILCDTEMSDLNDLKDHLVKAHDRTIHNDIKDTIIPFRLGEEGDDFTCVICSLEHASFKNLYQHMSIHYTNYCCEQCGVAYMTLGALRKHRKTHDQGNYPCDYCSKVFTSIVKKKYHEKGVHKGGWMRNKCPRCPEVFVSYYDKCEHLAKVHDEKPILFPCNACSKVYKKKFELNRHIRNHHLQQRRFTCTVCGARFFSMRGCLDHMERHNNGMEIYTCDVCGKSFNRSRPFKEHIKTHESAQKEDKKFECEICEKKFTQKSSLRAHMRLHQEMEIFKEFEDVQHLVDNREVTLKQLAIENKKREADEKATKEIETKDDLDFFNLD